MLQIFRLIATLVPVLVAVAVLLSGCGTIVGGSNYFAHVMVDNHPNADIYFNGGFQGKGSAIFKAPRATANRFVLTIKEPNCEKQVINFNKRVFRGGALVGTIFGWTAIVYPGNIPIPIGLVVDGITGALWKPDILEKGITQIDYKHFTYSVKYDGCPDNKTTVIPVNSSGKPTKAQQLLQLGELFDKGILTQEEFENEKKKVLAEEE